MLVPPGSKDLVQFLSCLSKSDAFQVPWCLSLGVRRSLLQQLTVAANSQATLRVSTRELKVTVRKLSLFPPCEL